jgi:alanine dehydrogenase
MNVGVPKEIKSEQYRVATLPVGALELAHAEHKILVEAGARQGSGIPDAALANSEATIVSKAAEIWCTAELVIKVKEPQPSEWPLLQRDQIIFTYFLFAADEVLTKAIVNSENAAIAYKALRDSRGGLPLLAHISEVSGRMSIKEGAKFLERPQEGRGILLSGVRGITAAEIALLGGGVVGSNAAKVAAGLGAKGARQNNLTERSQLKTVEVTRSSKTSANLF